MHFNFNFVCFCVVLCCEAERLERERRKTNCATRRKRKGCDTSG